MATERLSGNHTPSPNLNLRIGHDANSVAVPEWVRLLVALGTSVASESSDRKIVAGLALPTRMFAAAFSAFGIALVRVNQQTLVDPTHHFESLCKLPEGTPVAVHQHGSSRKKRGLLVGTRIVSGDRVVYVRLSDARKGNQELGLPPSQALRIEVIQEKEPRRNPFGTAGLAGVNPLLEELLPAVDAQRYVNHTNLDTLVLGHSFLVHNEILNTPIAVIGNRSNLVNGWLQDIVRLRVDHRHAYRSHVIPPGSRKMASYAKRLRPSVVVFDGASSFVRSRHHWKRSHWIVLLDRTEVQFQDATDALNEHYIQRTGDVRLRGLPIVPVGVEMCLFER